MNTIRTLRMGAVVLSLAFLASCGGAKTPEAVAKLFLNAIEKGDFATAKKYASASSQEVLDQMAEQRADSEASGEEIAEPAEINIGEVTVAEDDSTAEVKYTSDGTEMTLNMVKEEDEWKAEFTKLPGMGDMDEWMQNFEGMEDSLDEMLEGIPDSNDVEDEMNE